MDRATIISNKRTFMITVHTHNKLKWIDLSSPTPDEVRSIIAEYKIDSLVGEELLVPSLKPKVDLFSDYIYLILHFPAIRHSHYKDSSQEVDFIIGKDFLITAHYDSIDPLHKFSKVFDVNTILGKNAIGDHAGYIFYFMIKKLYKSLGHELDYIAVKQKKIEDRIFSGNEKEMVFELSKVSRELLQFKQSLSLHEEILQSLEVAGRKMFPEFEYHLKEILGSYYRVHGAITSDLDTLYELRATNDSLLSTKQNETIRVLAVITFLTTPLALVAGIFGMNTEFTPLVSDPRGFYEVLGIMLVIDLSIILFFKWKRWI